MTETPARRTLLCFGDSNTHGTVAMAHMDDIRRFDAATRWPGVMAQALGQGWHVVEEGHPGRTTVHDDPIEGDHKNGLKALPALLESHRPIDLVLIMLGTNDLKARFAVTAFDIGRSLERLARLVAQSNCGPKLAPPGMMLVSPVPIVETGFLGEMFRGGADKSRQLGPLVAETARRCGAGFLDAGSVAPIDAVDGIHLDAAAHASLGRAAAQAVGRMFPG